MGRNYIIQVNNECAFDTYIRYIGDGQKNVKMKAQTLGLTTNYHDRTFTVTDGNTRTMSYVLCNGVFAVDNIGLRAAHLPNKYFARWLLDPTKYSRAAIVAEALKLLGTKYEHKDDPKKGGLDCSGLAKYVYNKVTGLNLEHKAESQWKSGPGDRIKKKDLRPGDLVFFRKDGKIHHVGIYKGEGQMIHATSAKGEVVIGPIKRKNDVCVGGRRIIA